MIHGADFFAKREDTTLRILTIAGACLLLTAGAAQAQTPAPAAAPTPATAGPSVETTTIGDLIADPAAKGVLAKDMPDLLTYPGLDGIKGMTLRDISKYPEAKLDDAKLASIQKDLDAAKGH